MSNGPFAHTREGAPSVQWHLLEDHLRDTARRAEAHASAFGSGPWGELEGLWHDLGKYAPDFQDLLLSTAEDAEVGDASVLDARPARGRVDHSSAGAVHAYERTAGKSAGANKFPAEVAALTMVIAGHHSGLGKRSEIENERLKNPDKQARLREAKRGGAPAALLDRDLPELPPWLRFSSGDSKDQMSLRFEFWTRMLFSALIDADRLDTERARDPKRFDLRERLAARAASLGDLQQRLDAHLVGVSEASRARLAELAEGARGRAAAVLDLRARVLDACRTAAERPPGRHSLTVPTGGGKTLAALAFALGHALRHGLRRVIVVIPFTSIIDQTAKVYHDVFKGLGRAGKAAVIEHHSNLDPLRETFRNRLASENWDAPIIVTTSVQFFESLFTDKTTAARKLHNIARSVLIFDEVQTLPPELRAPIFDALNQLVDHYGCSALFCTATQPALGLAQVGRQDFPHLKELAEVVPDVPKAFAAVADRVEVEYPTTDGPTTWEELAARVASHELALAIVHRRDDARTLCGLLPADTYHLSALMCPAHRKEVLAVITAAIKADQPCRVVSTTLIEAGVDLDFPVVFRALGGIDAMAQAAGRCNREGRLCGPDGRPIPGRLILFHAPTDPPQGLQLGLETTGTLLKAGPLDLFAPQTYDRYFKQFFSSINPDRHGITRERVDRNFPEVAKRFQMIDDRGQVTLVVPFGDADRRIASYRSRPGRHTLRALQSFTVNVPQAVQALFEKAGLIEIIHDQVVWLKTDGAPQYDLRFGLTIDVIVPLNPDSLCV